MAQASVSLQHISVNLGGNQLLQDINLQIFPGQQWAIVGGSGSGKTTLAQVFTRQVFFHGELDYALQGNSQRIELVTQQHHFKSLNNTANFYYQQRFNASDANDSITVREALGDTADTGNWISLLRLEPLMDEPLLQLSNGENKRLQLARALLHNPGLLVLDSPFLGLDVKARETLHQLLSAITAKGIQLVLITAPAELPDCITHVAVLDKGRLNWAGPAAEYRQTHHHPVIVQPIDYNLLHSLRPQQEEDFEYAIKMEEVTVRYGERVILEHINWAVRKGECWNLSGPNGSGKSTLLSLVTGDNPQAYANRIVLFDRPRGSGESIWDIKRRIGFVSPELHVFFEPSSTCYEVVASGLFDTIGLFRQVSEAQSEKVMQWLSLLNLTASKDKRIFQLPASKQRMALLARALVKNPPLLILDEPTQGLDEEQTAYFKSLVNALCRAFGTTLVYVSHYSSDLPECISKYFKL